MCGRFTLRTPLKDVVRAFDLHPRQFELFEREPARFNIAPSQDVAAIRAAADDQPELVRLRWGLIPSWADDPAIGNQMINARAETIATKPAFREAFRRRRCLVPADGFYEWKKQNGAKQPYYIRLKEDRPFAFAGLWEHWRHGDAVIESCTIITTTANELLSSMHHRMPVILGPEHFRLWLDPAIAERERLEPLLAPLTSEALEVYPVSTGVNSPRHDAPDCIVAAAPGKVQGSLFD